MLNHGIMGVLKFEILSVLRQAFTWLTPLLFFVVIVSLFPLSVGPDQLLLAKIAPGIIWVGSLLAILLSIGSLFKTDAQEGFLDLLLLSSYPLIMLIACKVLSHWLTHCLPVILISPILGFMLHLSLTEQWVLLISLLLGTPALSMIGTLGAALLINIRGNGLLLPLIIIPLYIPILIFGTSAVSSVTLHQPLNGYFAILAALSLFSLVFAPPLTAVALRIGMNQ